MELRCLPDTQGCKLPLPSFRSSNFKASLKKHPSSGLKFINQLNPYLNYIYSKQALMIPPSPPHTTWHALRSI